MRTTQSKISFGDKINSSTPWIKSWSLNTVPKFHGDPILSKMWTVANTIVQMWTHKTYFWKLIKTSSSLEMGTHLEQYFWQLDKNTSANDPSNCSPIAARRSSFHTFEVSCLRHLSRQVPPFCMCGSSHKGCLGNNCFVIHGIEQVVSTSPPSWDDNRSGKGAVWHQGCGCKRSRTPDKRKAFVNMRSWLRSCTCAVLTV